MRDLRDPGLGRSGAGHRVHPPPVRRLQRRVGQLGGAGVAAAAGSSGRRRRWPAGSAPAPTPPASAPRRWPPAAPPPAAAAGGTRVRAAAARRASRRASRSSGSPVCPARRSSRASAQPALIASERQRNVCSRVCRSRGNPDACDQPADQLAGAQLRVGGELRDGEADAVQVEQAQQPLPVLGADRGGPATGTGPPRPAARPGRRAAASCRRAAQSALVSRPASPVSASSPTTGTTSETVRASSARLLLGQRPGHRPRVAGAADQGVDLAEHAERVDRAGRQPGGRRPGTPPGRARRRRGPPG